MMSVLPMVTAMIMLFVAGFVNDFFPLAKKEPEEKQPLFIQNQRIYITARVAAYALIIIALYILVTTSSVVLAVIYYLFMEYGLPHVLRPYYRKYFGIPSEALKET